MQKRFILTCGLTVVSLAAAACGGTTPSTGSASPAGSMTTISVADNPKLGKIVVDGSGKTLYLFEGDKSTASTCYGDCASYWPPVLTAGAPHAGTGVNASLLGTTQRKDGTRQVTYAGHPLYYVVTDHKAGGTTGQGVSNFGALWWVLSPSGAALTTK
jgi:predicted lipoprotein with Yx(FWY)xxD motif